MDQSPFFDLLDEQPEIGYYSHLGDRGFSQGKQRRLRGMLGDIRSQYLGGIGDAIRQGLTPTQRWAGPNSFLQNFDFDAYHQGLSPMARGEMNTAPRVRFLRY